MKKCYFHIPNSYLVASLEKIGKQFTCTAMVPYPIRFYGSIKEGVFLDEKSEALNLTIAGMKVADDDPKNTEVFVVINGIQCICRKIGDTGFKEQNAVFELDESMVSKKFASSLAGITDNLQQFPGEPLKVLVPGEELV